MPRLIPSVPHLSRSIDSGEIARPAVVRRRLTVRRPRIRSGQRREGGGGGGGGGARRTVSRATMDTAQSIFSFGKSFIQAPTEVKKALEQLEAKLPSARLLISRSEWGMFKNKDLDELILQLRSATYDAEDLLRGFEDQAQRQKIEDASRSSVGQLYSSSMNSATHFLHGSSARVRETQDKLEKAMAVVDIELNRMGLPVVPEKVMPITTEFGNASQVFGRDTERDQVMEMLGVTLAIDRSDEINKVIKQMGVSASSGTKGKSAESAGPDAGTSTPRPAKRLKVNGTSSANRPAPETTNYTSNVSVMPIFGIGGMGKTTLAQLIYNDERVQVHFTVRIWVCVSDLFDEKRMIEEIFKAISDPNIELPCDLRIRSELQERLKIQKFLLVLDDMWDDAEPKWEHFYALLRHGLEGSMILVTTRLEKVVRLVATSNCKPVELKGLPDDVFWEFFKQCAFGKERPESYPHLQGIGRSISSKLCGTPLAAKTLGRLLNSNLTEEHWVTINNSELWEQEQNEGEILPALRLSYLHLPTELRRCFAFCSVFPKDYSFKRDKIVDIWVAEGFVSPQVRQRLEDVGMTYFDQLRDRYLFQTDPKFHNSYVMHDLIHDTAQQASMHECFLMKDLNKVVHKVRHMSVMVKVGGRECLRTMEGIQHLNTLRSLWFSWSSDVKNIRFSLLPNIMFLSLRGCILDLEGGLPESICELSSLRYLDISGIKIKELPPKFWSLYSLQFLYATGLRTIHGDVTKLVNLRQLALPVNPPLALSKVRGLGNLSCLQKLSYFTLVRKNGGFRELKGMNQLRGTLSIRAINTVRNKEEAAEARLADKKYIEELDLHWRIYPRICKPTLSENEVIESLRPYERIQRLKIHGFWGDTLPSWLNPNDLKNLRSLEISRCPYFKTLPILHFAGGTQGGSRGQNASSSSTSTNCSNGITSLAFAHITILSLVGCSALKSLDQFLSSNNLPSVEFILLEDCDSLESIPVESFAGFFHLKKLKLCRCSSLVCSQEIVFTTLTPVALYFVMCKDREFISIMPREAHLTHCPVLHLVPKHKVDPVGLDHPQEQAQIPSSPWMHGVVVHWWFWRPFIHRLC